MNSDFQNLLDQKANIDITRNTSNANSQSKKLQLKANKSATMFEFVKMIDRLVTLTIPNARFIPDEGKIAALDAMEKFDDPMITFKVLERTAKNELKPRVRESIVEIDKLNETRVGEVYGQKFKCLIQFNIFASVYTEAEEVMEKFEELITTYTGFFKKNGVAEILFEKHVTDDNYAKLRETLSIRNLIYYVEIEKLTVIFKEKIKEIEILAQNKEE